MPIFIEFGQFRQFRQFRQFFQFFSLEGMRDFLDWDSSPLEVFRMTTPRELIHFLLLPPEEQLAAIYRLHQLGWSDYGIASATRLSVEQVRRLLSEAKAHAG
jgi:hypothetical protein